MVKEMSKEEWIKESRFLYHQLKELYVQWIELQIQSQDIVTPEVSVINQMVEGSWKIFCIEKNIKPEDYGL